jgi:hypothetical protein
MKRVVIHQCLLMVCLTFMCCSAQESTDSKLLTKFSDHNFGIHFSHSRNVSTTYNTHGGADKVILNYRDKAIGGLIVRPAPAMKNIEEFIEAGKTHFKEKWGASEVNYQTFENDGKYKFHHLKTEVKRNGEEYVLERYVYLRQDTAFPADTAEKIIRSISGAFSFEFIYLKKDQESIKSEIKTVIDTFKIDGISGSQPKAAP